MAQSFFVVEKRLKSPIIAIPTAKLPTTIEIPIGIVIGSPTGPASNILLIGMIPAVFHTATIHRTNKSGSPISLSFLIALKPIMAVRDMASPPIIVKITGLIAVPLTSLIIEETVLPNRSAWNAYQPKLEKHRIMPIIFAPWRPNGLLAVNDVDKWRCVLTMAFSIPRSVIINDPSTLTSSISLNDRPLARRPPVARPLRPKPEPSQTMPCSNQVCLAFGGTGVFS